MGAPESVGAGAEALVPDLAAQHQVAVAGEQVEHRGVEGGQPLGGRRARSERRISAQQLFLELPFVLVQQGYGDRRAIGIRR